MPPTTQPLRHVVTAIIVAHDGARLLPGLVRALRSQTYPIQRAVGVDTGSRDRGGAVLAELMGADAVFGMDRSCGYPAALAAALAHPAARRGGVGGVEWVWLLHDDCEPAPDALEILLRAAVKDRAIAVVGPKVRDLADRRVLRETGVTIDRAGRRITGIEPGEIDQGQHDGNRGVLAVGSAGMLVRRDVWEDLGGFDQSLNMFRDDVDFCWRAHAAGYRVQVVTDAVLYHRELGARRVRDAGGPHPRRLDRRNALYVLAVNLPFLAMVRILVGCVAGSLLRAVWFLLTKQTGKATDQLAALGGVAAHPLALWKARRRRRRTRRAGYAAVRGYLPGSRTLRRIAESVAGLISAGPRATAGGHRAQTQDPDDEQFTDEQSLLRRLLSFPLVRLTVALTLVAVVAERRLLGGGMLGGGALVPAWSGAAGLWQSYVAGFHSTGVGSTAVAPPYLAMVAMLAWLVAGKTWLIVNVLLLGCVPLAGLTAYVAAGRVVTSTSARVIGACAYALLPVAMGAIAAGRLGTAVVVVLLPLIGRAATRMITRAREDRVARRAAWATGLLIGIAAGFVPLMWVLAALLAAGAAGWTFLAGRRGWQPGVTVSPANAVITAVAPGLVLLPWSLSLLTHPGGFLLEAGIARPGLSASGLGVPSLLLLHPGGPGLPPAWIMVGLALTILGLLVQHRRRLVGHVGWVFAIVGLAAAVFVSKMTITAGGVRVPAWPGPELAVTGAGLVLAALPVLEWLAGRVTASGGGRARRATSAAALVAVASAPALAAGFWLVSGVRGPVTGVSNGVLPAFVSVTSAGPDQPRTLILRRTGGVVSYSILRAFDPSLGDPELAAPDAASSALAGTVAALVSAGGGGAGDPGDALSDFGVKWVMLPEPVDAGLAQRIDAAGGLTRVSTSSAYDLWEVAGTVARARVVEPDGTVVALPSAGLSVDGAAPTSGGTLVLAEPASGWTATLNGRTLSPKVINGWEQAFAVPPGGGTLSVSRDGTWRGLTLILQAVAVLAVAVLALPGKRTESVAEAVEVPEEVADGARSRAHAVASRGRAAASRGRAVASRASRPRLGAVWPRTRVPESTDTPEPAATDTASLEGSWTMSAAQPDDPWAASDSYADTSSGYLGAPSVGNEEPPTVVPASQDPSSGDPSSQDPADAGPSVEDPAPPRRTLTLAGRGRRVGRHGRHGKGRDT